MSSADLKNLVVVVVVVVVVASINGLLDGFEINFPSDDVTSVSKIEKALLHRFRQKTELWTSLFFSEREKKILFSRKNAFRDD